MLKYLTLFVIVLAIGFLCVTESHALIVGPARFEARLPAGEIAGINYYVQNDTDAPVHVIVEPENWFRDIYDYKELAAKDWIKIDKSEFDLKPKEIKKILLTLKVPKTSQGELVAQIFFTSAASEGAGSSTSVNARLGAILYVAVKGTEKFDAKIKDIVAAVAEKDKDRQLKFEVSLLNEGNVHIRPSGGGVTIFDEKGRKVKDVDIDVNNSALPGREASFSAKLSEPGLKEGAYTVKAWLRYGKMYGREKKAVYEKQFIIEKNGEITPK